MKKVLTYHIDAGDGELITTDLITGLEYEVPPKSDLEKMGDDPNCDPDSEDSFFWVTIKVKKCFTQEEVDALPEKD